jgi:hypothetical protein
MEHYRSFFRASVSRKDFLSSLHDIQPTVCRYASRSLERFGSGFSSVPLVSFSRGDSARRFLKLGKRFDFVATENVTVPFSRPLTDQTHWRGCGKASEGF